MIGRREGSMTVEVSSNGVEYTRGGMAHREARLTVVGPSRRDDAWGDAQPVPIWARHDREAPVRWEPSSVVACTAPRSGAGGRGSRW